MVMMMMMVMMMVLVMMMVMMMLVVMMVVMMMMMLHTFSVDIQSLCRLVVDCKPYNLFFFSQKMKTHFLWVGVSKVNGIISVRGDNGIES
jgi:hypothetical protein